MNRFYVRVVKQISSDRNYYQVCDRYYAKFRMPELAISISLNQIESANLICLTLNNEWDRFVAKPW